MQTLRNKKILVTGAAGFIGSFLIKRLVEEHAEVHALIQEAENLFRIRDTTEKISIHQGDIADFYSVRHCIEKVKPEVVFHLAAVRNVQRDLTLLDKVIDINLKGTANLIKVLGENKQQLQRFISTGTCEEYGDGQVPFKEEQREIPVSPYSFSKVAATYLCQMVHITTGMPIVVVRPFLTYGPYQSIDMFVPSVIYHCISKKDFQMTSGDQTREFNYVEDIVEGFVLAAVCKGAVGEVINIGNGIEYKVREVAEKIVSKFDNTIKLNAGTLAKRVGEARNFYCSNEKAKKLLGWQPRYSLDEGLDISVKWYKKHAKDLGELGGVE